MEKLEELKAIIATASGGGCDVLRLVIKENLLLRCGGGRGSHKKAISVPYTPSNDSI